MKKRYFKIYKDGFDNDKIFTNEQFDEPAGTHDLGCRKGERTVADSLFGVDFARNPDWKEFVDTAYVGDTYSARMSLPTTNKRHPRFSDVLVICCGLEWQSRDATRSAFVTEFMQAVQKAAADKHPNRDKLPKSVQ